MSDFNPNKEKIDAIVKRVPKKVFMETLPSILTINNTFWFGNQVSGDRHPKHRFSDKQIFHVLNAMMGIYLKDELISKLAHYFTFEDYLHRPVAYPMSLEKMEMMEYNVWGNNPVKPVFNRVMTILTQPTITPVGGCLINKFSTPDGEEFTAAAWFQPLEFNPFRFLLGSVSTYQKSEVDKVGYEECEKWVRPYNTADLPYQWSEFVKSMPPDDPIIPSWSNLIESTTASLMHTSLKRHQKGGADSVDYKEALKEFENDNDYVLKNRQ